MMNQEAMARRMQGAEAQEGGDDMQKGGGDEKQPSGMEVVKNVDQMIGMLAQSMSGLPGGKQLSTAMMQVKERFRAIIQQAMAAAQGGAQGGAPGQGSQGQTMPQAGAEPDMSRGRPYSPAGV